MPLVGICSFKDGREKRLKIILRINFIYEFEKIIQKEESCCLGCLLKSSLSLKIYTAAKTKVPIDSFMPFIMPFPRQGKPSFICSPANNFTLILGIYPARLHLCLARKLQPAQSAVAAC